MNTFQTYFEEIRQLLILENYLQLTKRIIDLTLDTGDIEHYRKTIRLLDWLDNTDTASGEIKNAYAAILNELYETLKEKPVKTTANPILVVENLISTYKKSSFALGPLSLKLSEGEIIGLVGENGNGKTTLLRNLCGEIQPVSGILDYKFIYKDRNDLRSRLIYIPQRTDVWHGSLLANLQFTATSYGICGEENECIVQLIIARMGLRKYRKYSWKSLSSGYKMRFELARALLRRPKLLLIDEPLANLDILAQQIILTDFRDITHSPFRPLGIILSSQQLYEVEKISNQVIFLKNGYSRDLRQEMGKNFYEIKKLIIEFESEWTYEQIFNTLKALDIEQLQVNGSTYVATFPDTTNVEDFLSLVIKQNIPLVYFRNISNSTRRFFLS